MSMATDYDWGELEDCWPPPDGEEFFAVALGAAYAKHMKGEATMTVQEVLGMQEGFPVVGLQVRVQSTSQLYQGNKDGRNWTKLILHCGDNTGQIDVTWWNGNIFDPKLMENQLVTVNSRSHKGNLVGARLKRNRSGDLEISCNDTCLQHELTPQQAPAAQPQAQGQARSGGVPPARKNVFTDTEIIENWCRWVKELAAGSGASVDVCVHQATSIAIGVQRGDIVINKITEVAPGGGDEADSGTVPF